MVADQQIPVPDDAVNELLPSRASLAGYPRAASTEKDGLMSVDSVTQPISNC